MLQNTPAYLPKITAKKKKQLLESIAHGEAIRLEILKTYKTSATAYFSDGGHRFQSDRGQRFAAKADSISS